MSLKGNCRNEWTMEGYAECITAKKDHKDRDEITFKLTSIHTPVGTNRHHYTPIKVVLKEKQAKVVSVFLKPMMLVICEGHFTLGKEGGVVMDCQRVYPGEPYITEIDYKLSEEVKANGGN